MKLTESKLKKAPASKYMNTDQLDFFKEKLISDHENEALRYNSLILFFS